MEEGKKARIRWMERKWEGREEVEKGKRNSDMWSVTGQEKRKAMQGRGNEEYPAWFTFRYSRTKSAFAVSLDSRVRILYESSTIGVPLTLTSQTAPHLLCPRSQLSISSCVIFLPKSNRFRM